MDPIRIRLTDSLYGLRAIAALIVVLSHASKKGFYLVPGLDFSGTGKMAVWMFFLLSAFILTWQYLENAKSRTPYQLVTFITRRIFRIFPLFWVAILLDWLLGRITWEHVWNSLLLISAPNHFWAVPVEFQYYLLVPLVASAFAIQQGVHKFIFVAVLMLVALLIQSYNPPIALAAFLPCFITGSLLAFYVASSRNLLKQTVLIRLSFIGGGMAVLATPAIMQMIGLNSVFDQDMLRNNSTLFGIVFSPIILASIGVPKFQEFLSHKWFQRIGKISFSIYLLHPLAIDLINEINIHPIASGWAILTLTLGFATIGYLLVERPIRTIGYRLTRRESMQVAGHNPVIS